MITNWPLRAKNEADFPLKKIDKQIIAAAVLLQLDNQSAFALYHPEYIDGTGRLNSAGKQASRQFWSWGKVKDYRLAYETDVEEFLNGKKRTAKSDAVSIDDSRKDRALKSLLNQAMSLVEGGSDLDAETIKMCSDIFTKLGLIKSEEERQIAPIRVLVSRCKSECNYCFYVETAKAKGLMFDSCDYCKARKIAEEHGFKFDHCTLLDVPPEVVKEIESHNDVKLTDILDNGQTTRADIEKQFNDLDSDEHNN